MILFLLNCKKDHFEQTAVVFDTDFAGARMDSVVLNEKGQYIAYINPAFEPVNKSPWFAFAISSEEEREIEVVLNYGAYKHRYIPKLSTDRKSWKKIASSKIKIDTNSGTATLQLTAAPQKRYIAAQEIESSSDTYSWMDSLIKVHSFLTKESAGQTVLNEQNYVVTSNDNLKHAIVLIARQHPPEIPGGTIGFKAFYETLLADSDIAKLFRETYNIITFPLLNPDGANMGNWRHNANGIDLNRDWVDFSQPETQMVKSYLENHAANGTKIEFAVDFHTSYSGPYLLVLDSINEVKTKGIIPNWISNIEANSKFKVEARRRSQELPYCYNYFFNEIGCEAVTYEDGDEIERALIRQRAAVYAEELMQSLLTLTTKK